MKRLFTLFFALIAITSSAVTPSPSTPKPMTGTEFVSDTNPLPTKVIGTPSVTITGVQTVKTATDALDVNVLTMPVITATVTVPIASATANSANSMPVALGASDQSAIQRLFTAIVQGDGVNGNNMLPMAQYLWNGVTFDRAPTKPTVASQVILLLDSTDQLITLIPHMQSISLSATGTFEYALDMPTVPANTTPCTLATEDITASVTVVVKTSASGTYLTVRMKGN